MQFKCKSIGQKIFKLNIIYVYFYCIVFEYFIKLNNSCKYDTYFLLFKSFLTIFSALTWQGGKTYKVYTDSVQPGNGTYTPCSLHSILLIYLILNDVNSNCSFVMSVNKVILLLKICSIL